MKYTKHFEVMSLDVDMNNHVRPSSFFRYMQETADHQMRDRKPSYMELLESGKSLILTRMSLEIYHQLEEYDEIDVSTWRCPDLRATYRRCYDITRSGEICAAAYSEWALVSVEDRKILPTSAADFSSFEEDGLLDLSIPKRFHFPKDLPFEEAGVRHVDYELVDMNSHLNNTRYPDLLFGLIPGIVNQEVTSLNVRFMKEALLGKDIRIDRAEPEVSFAGDPAAERAAAFQSYVDGHKNIEAVFGLRTIQDTGRFRQVRK
ncbi:MAG: thioesterase [Eubacteriales bacterium]|nr:thioesterase [Eubacteriales bacterium]